MTIGGPIAVPDVLTGLLGDDAASKAWADSVVELARECAERWHLELGYVVPDTVPVFIVRSSKGGKPCTLKLYPPGTAFDAALRIQRAAEGRGYTRVFGFDSDRRGLLVEPVGATLGERLGDDVEGADRVAAAVLGAAWTLPLDIGRPAERHPAERLSADVADLAEAHDPGGVIVSRALAYARHRLEDDAAREVVVHGDPTPRSVRLLNDPRDGAETGFVLVDPQGIRLTPEYDLGIWLSSWNKWVLRSGDPLVALRGRCARLAGASGTDAEAIWQWTMLHRVHRGLTLLAGPEPLTGRPFVAAARVLTDRQR